MGGLLGMLLAARPFTPVKRLVLNDVGAFIPMDALQSIARNLEAPDRFASLADIEAHMRGTRRDWGDLTEEQWRHFAVHGARRDGAKYRLHYDPQITQLVRPFPLAPGVFFWDAWYRVRCPVLLLRGERSNVLPEDVARLMVQIRPDTQLVEIEGCGHVPALMSEAQIALVRNFCTPSSDKAPWPRLPSSSFPGFSRIPTVSSIRSPGSAGSRPAPSPT